MPRAPKPRAHGPTRWIRPQRAPGENLSHGPAARSAHIAGPPHPGAERAPRERHVCEVPAAHHVAGVRAGRAAEAPVVAELRKAVPRTDSVQEALGPPAEPGDRSALELAAGAGTWKGSRTGRRGVHGCPRQRQRRDQEDEPPRRRYRSKPHSFLPRRGRGVGVGTTPCGRCRGRLSPVRRGYENAQVELHWLSGWNLCRPGESSPAATRMGGLIQPFGGLRPAKRAVWGRKAPKPKTWTDRRSSRRPRRPAPARA